MNSPRRYIFVFFLYIEPIPGEFWCFQLTTSDGGDNDDGDGDDDNDDDDVDENGDDDGIDSDKFL